MATDIRRLRPGELCRLLNSTSLGECIGERTLHRQRIRAGLRVAADGDPARVDLLRYVAWLAERRHQPRAPAPPALSDYEAHRERARLRNATLSVSGRDIGAIPPCLNPERRREALSSLRSFVDIYGGSTFTLPWSPVHLKFFARLEDVAANAGLYAEAMPRGWGKTNLAEWTMLYTGIKGLRRYGLHIAASRGEALESIASIQTEIESNAAIAEDFPEVCYPIDRLEGMPQRCTGQLCGGERTHIEWSAERIVFPTIKGSACSGFILDCVGIEGKIRGRKFKRPDGVVVRPDFVLIDDPQDDEIAKSPSQVDFREQVISKSVLLLPAPKVKLAALALLTVIETDDLADRLLDRKRHPEWRGERLKMVESMPTDMELWREYRRIQREHLESGGDGTHATEFYASYRAQLDAGCVMNWPERFDPGEISGIQHAMNLYFRDEDAFLSEGQQTPRRRELMASDALVPNEIVNRRNGVPRGTVPTWATKLTAFIDVQGEALYWLVAAWSDDFTGAVVDYGAWPEQRRNYFTLATLKRTLSVQYPGLPFEALLHRGLTDCTAFLAGREWPQEGGNSLRIDRLLVDGNWGKSTDVVYAACRASPNASSLRVSHGRGVKASGAPMRDWAKKEGERIGPYWRERRASDRGIRHVISDGNFWKSFTVARLRTPLGSPGSLTLCGGEKEDHQMIAEQWSAERPVRVSAAGRIVDEWVPLPARDNHLWDCIVGAAVAASTLGATLGLPGEQSKRKRVRLTPEEMIARAHSRPRKR